MRTTCLTNCLIVITLGCACARAEEMTFKPNWKVGEKQVYEIKTTAQLLFEHEKADEPAKRKFTLAIEVIRADDKAIHLRCKYGEIELENEYRTLYVDHQVGKSFVLQCNPDGSNMRIENVDEIKKSYPKLIQDLYELRGERGQKEELNKVIFEGQNSEEAKKEFIDSFVADAIFLFFPYGKTLDSAKPLKFEGEWPIPFSDKKTYPSDIEWKLLDTATYPKGIEIQWIHTTNPKKMAPLIEEMIRELEAANKLKYPEEISQKFRRISHTTTASFQYDTKSTWMISAKKQNLETGLASDYKKTWEYRLITK